MQSITDCCATGSMSCCRYQRDREKPPEAASNMKRLLGELKHLILRQKIALDLGWNDLVQPKFDTGYMNDLHRL